MRVLIWAACAVQVAIFASNFVLPQKIQCRENLARVSPMTRHVFIVHWIYILVILVIFACLCFCFAPELAGASRLARLHGTANALGFTLCGLLGWMRVATTTPNSRSVWR